MDRIADYQFIQPLGEGSSGKYFLAATPPRLGIAADHVAVKVLQVSAGEEAFHRLTRELRTFAKVRSANLVTLYDAGQEAGQCYYAMEYCPGGLAGVPRPGGDARRVPSPPCRPPPGPPTTCTRRASPTATSSRPTSC